MKLIRIDSVNGYKPRPDFLIQVYENGQVHYKGRYYVGVTGEQQVNVEAGKMREIKLMLDFLVKRNQRNHLKRSLVPLYSVEVGEDPKTRFEIDENDVVSDDIIGQILDLTGVQEWIQADLDLYLVMSKPESRSRELGVLRAPGKAQAVSMYMNERPGRNYRNSSDFWSFCIGHQNPGELANPVIYFTYSDYQIQEHSVTLVLNQGPDLLQDDYKVYLFISFGKRYNDPRASCFLVLARDAASAHQVFKSTYPHFMPRDFQLVDTGVIYNPNPLFTTQIPVAIR